MASKIDSSLSTSCSKATSTRSLRSCACYQVTPLGVIISYLNPLIENGVATNSTSPLVIMPIIPFQVPFLLFPQPPTRPFLAGRYRSKVKFISEAKAFRMMA